MTEFTSFQAVSDIDLVLQVGAAPDTNKYGNNWLGATGASSTDPVVKAALSLTSGQASAGLQLTFDGFDIDYANEVRIEVNGHSLGFLAAGLNEASVGYSLVIDASLLLTGSNEINFIQAANATWKWGVTNIAVSALPPPGGTDLTLAVGAAPDTGKYGNNWPGATGASSIDPEVKAALSLTAAQAAAGLQLTFDGFDIDFADEVRIEVNGHNLGFLAAGLNEGIVGYSLVIDPSVLLTGANEIDFIQAGNPTWKWGVTNIAVKQLTVPGATDLTLQFGAAPDTGKYGNNWTGATGASATDPVVKAALDLTSVQAAADLELTFDGFDIDYSNEVRIEVNGQNLGFLAAGFNEATASYSLVIDSSLLVSGANEIDFIQAANPTWKWGVTNIAVGAVASPDATDLTLQFGAAPDTGKYGNNWAGASGASATDPVVKAALSLTAEQAASDVELTFDGYDIDSAIEVRIEVNGQSLGFLPAGVNDGMASYSFVIDAGLLQAGDNVIDFIQAGNASWKWGVTNIAVDTPLPADAPDLTLQYDAAPDIGKYGNLWAGATGASPSDPVVKAALSLTAEQAASDLELTFDGYDIDSAIEVRIEVNGQKLGFLAAGVNDGLASYSFLIEAGLLQAGDNVIDFIQAGNASWKWGVTNVAVGAPANDVDMTLELGAGPDTGMYGNHWTGATGASDTDPVVKATLVLTADQAAGDLELTFDGYDIDYGDEVRIEVNGHDLGFIAAGINEDLASYTVRIDSDTVPLVQGVNEIKFIQSQDPIWKWGVTNVRVEADHFDVPTDTLYESQWHLSQIGDIERIWADFTGAGISVAVYDTGVQYNHPDLDDNYDASKHVSILMPDGSNPPQMVSVQVDGMPVDTSDPNNAHGTAVAGVIAAEADGAGSVGVAHGASLTGVNMYSDVINVNDAATFPEFVTAMEQMDTFDIVNHSWGWYPRFSLDAVPGDPAPDGATFYSGILPTLENAAVNGRAGLGTIMVKSAGNGDGSGFVGNNSEGDELNASRYTISVAASNDERMISYYSDHGANLLVSAPSDDPYGAIIDFTEGREMVSNEAIVTTDFLGADGYDTGDYTTPLNGFGGTSSAAPVVSGVVALMLDANEGLGWRDVQTILAYSATHVGSAIGAADLVGGEDFGWTVNGANNWNGGGLHVSEDYGFGNVDAYAATRMAEVWNWFGEAKTSGNEITASAASATPVSLSAATTVVDIDMTDNMQVEQVEVSLDLQDSAVDVFLISPDDTRIQLLAAGDAPAGALTWDFGAQLFRGESLAGTWHLEFSGSDATPAAQDDVSWAVNWWGSPDTADDVYHYTEEIFAAIVDLGGGVSGSLSDADSQRTVIADGDGGNDWADMAAMTSDLVVDLAGGTASSATGGTFISSGLSDIENVVTGDGDDVLVGNASDNVLIGMRGDDELTGGGGSDVFVFKAGFGHDVITDFTGDLTAAIGDVVDFTGVNEVTDYAGFLAALDDTGSDLIYDLNGDGADVLTFKGLNIADITETDFVFSGSLLA